MTREEEIINAAIEARMASAETLTTRGTHHSIDDVPFVDKMITYDEVAENAFIKGAEWADTHPINVWHDVTEEPMDRRRTIVLYGTNPVGVTSCNYEDILLTFRETWSAYVFLSKFSLWAYLDELLPKGGE